MKLLQFIWHNKLKITKVATLLFTISMGLLFTLAYFSWRGKKEVVVKKLDNFARELTDNTLKHKFKPVEIYDSKQVLIGSFSFRKLKPIRKENIRHHKNLIWAVLSSEDRKFYSHWGVNFTALFRAVLVNLYHLRMVQGGSTISQQLAKLALQHKRRTLYNKITELYCTFYLERKFDKDTILAMYLNEIFMGNDNYGMEEASRFYFRIPAAKLSAAEAAMLAGTIQAPSVYNPMRRLKISLQKQKTILKVMSEHHNLRPGFSDPKTQKQKPIEKLIKGFKKRYAVKTRNIFGKKVLVSDIGKYGYDKDFLYNRAKDFNRSIREFILSHFSVEEFGSKALKVYTTLDIQKQVAAEAAMRYGFSRVEKALQKRKAYYLKKNNRKEARREDNIIETMNGSLVSLNPANGHIEAMIGSYKFSSIYKLNRAEYARRQPGSAIKGFLYTLAFEQKRITPSTLVVDEPIDFGGYKPRNWYKGYKGEVTIRKAVAYSINTIPVKLLDDIGVDYFLDKLADVLNKDSTEIHSRFNRNLSLALGSGEVTPLELAIIYATIANDGRRVIPKKILKVVDSEDNIIYAPEVDVNDSEQVLDPIACAMAINTLQSVLTKLGTMPVTASFAKAGKTGTVQSPKIIKKKWGNRSGVRDAWFSGILPGQVTTLWIGNDEGAPFPGSGSGTTGSTWVVYARSLHAKGLIADTELIPPFEADYTKVDVCGETGKQLIEGVACEFPLQAQYYYAGFEPEKPEVVIEAPIEEEDEPDLTTVNAPPIVTPKTTTKKVETEIEERNQAVNEGVELDEPDTLPIEQ